MEERCGSARMGGRPLPSWWLVTAATRGSCWERSLGDGGRNASESPGGDLEEAGKSMITLAGTQQLFLLEPDK
jgi:hypothetical protein